MKKEFIKNFKNLYLKIINEDNSLHIVKRNLISFVFIKILSTKHENTIYEKEFYEQFVSKLDYLKIVEKFLNDYKFNIKENSEELNPEILSDLFEFLLEDNKSKGAYYTPKSIVNYMCDESLIAYLSDNQNDKKISSFVKEGIVNFNNDEKLCLLTKIKDVKTCDPSVGCGAFPIRLLEKIYQLRLLLEDTTDKLLIKKEIIENNLYGMDIEEGAINVTKLRMYLYCISESDDIIPIETIDYKMKVGNSLLELGDNQHNTVEQLELL